MISNRPPTAVLEAALEDLTQQHQRRVLKPRSPGSYPAEGFNSNDYLNLSRHPALALAAQQAVADYGVGATGSRLLCGDSQLQHDVEAQLAKLKGSETALIFNTGYLANAGILAALLDRRLWPRGVQVFADRLIHASMYQGLRSAGVRCTRFAHNDLSHLKELLQRSGDTDFRLILTESVFSMDGDLAPLSELQKLAKEYDAWLYVDEAHATGVFGSHGQGLAATEENTLIMGTCSKALGSFGGFLCCSAVFKDYLINKAPSLIYATALPPAVLGSIQAALSLLPSLDKEREYLLSNAAIFRKYCLSLGFDTGESHSQIVPLILGKAEDALSLSSALEELGVNVGAIRPPTVPPSGSRLRFTFTSAQREEHIEQLCHAIARVS